ncbi:SDR family oxidoreductase [Amycolatopsis sp. CA-230715]|uniref:SDR family oxidoreductase n=1 Tax=Amycolatopsis sp. CA-230715 TaxID=2745196 RepID=UPI001C023980|nr:SDR family oxidoreductase [Amycolatopsis sp. CA-230715]QWF82475.1 3-oxoacyl-[acyl-carrier-protein] reductase FabG [Amycolatopsis sp. CA-230715]
MTRTALVTGGSRGIGRAIVLRLAEDGADVVFSYHSDETAARDVVAEVRGKGGRATAVRADVTDAAQIERLFEAVPELDVLVNNAGIGSAKVFGEVTEQWYDHVMAVNAKGAFFVLQQAIPRLRQDGRVINISSSATAWPSLTDPVYAAGKAAVEQFTKVAARQLGPRRITVNTVSPGPVHGDAVPDEATAAIAALTPLGRMAEPADIADVVAMLAGRDGRWITGQNLIAAGGML